MHSPEKARIFLDTFKCQTSASPLQIACQNLTELVFKLLVSKETKYVAFASHRLTRKFIIKMIKGEEIRTLDYSIILQ